MAQESPLGILSGLSARSLGVFRGRAAVELGLSRKQLTSLCKCGVVVRELPDTYRMTAVPRSGEQRIRAALLWAGDDAAAAGTSAGELFGLEGVCAPQPEIVVSRSSRIRSPRVIVHHSDDRAALMVRNLRKVIGILRSPPWR